MVPTAVLAGDPRHGVDPFAYLKDVLTRIPTHPADRRHELIPRKWKKRFGLATVSADSSAAA